MKRVLSTVALACTVLLAATSTAEAAGGSPVRVSRGDPFTNCLVGGNGSGRNFRSAEEEPWIAVNPANTANLVGVWQQDRWSDGGAKGQVAGFSFDGGRTWSQSPQPFTMCAQPFFRTRVLQYERTSDPWVSIGPDGTVYTISLPFDGDFIRNGMGVAVSHNGGRTWVGQQDIDPLVARADTGLPSDDKQSITADPQRVGFAYGVWDQLQDVFPPCPTAPGRAAVIRSHETRQLTRRSATTASAQPCPNLTTGPTFFSRTTDGGKTWEKPRAIVPTGVNEQTIGNVIVANRQTGVLFDFFDFIDAAGTSNIQMVFSTDQGVTWSERQQVQRLMTTAEKRSVPGGCFCGVVFPGDPTKPLRTGDIIPEPAIDPNTGQLYVIWQDGRPNNFQNDMLLASTSTAGGLSGTWSEPTLVNPPTDKAAFTPGISVDSEGRVGVTYYDLTPPITRPDVLLTDTWFTATSGPGLDFGSRRLIGGPFNMEAAPVARGFFVGDYMGLAARIAAPEDESGGATSARTAASRARGGTRGFAPIFVMTNCRDNSCRAQGTLDGSPAGPDSTDVFSRALPSD